MGRDKRHCKEKEDSREIIDFRGEYCTVIDQIHQKKSRHTWVLIFFSTLISLQDNYTLILRRKLLKLSEEYEVNSCELKDFL